MSGSNRSAGNPALIAHPSDDAKDGEQVAQRNDASGNNLVEAVTPPVERPASQREASMANQRAQTEQAGSYDLRDLIAQEEMADAAFWMMIAALLTLVVTSAGTVLLLQQVKLTRRAVGDNNRSIAIAAAANEITERIGMAQARAYLSVSADSFTIDDDNWLDVGFKVVNSGQSPARKVRIQIEAFLVSGGKRRIVGLTAKEIGDLPVGGSGKALIEVDCKPEMRQQLLAGFTSFQFDVAAEYETVFDGVSDTDAFTFEGLVLDEFKRLILQPLPRNRIVRMHGRARLRRETDADGAD